MPESGSITRVSDPESHTDHIPVRSSPPSGPYHYWVHGRHLFSNRLIPALSPLSGTSPVNTGTPPAFSAHTVRFVPLEQLVANYPELPWESLLSDSRASGGRVSPLTWHSTAAGSVLLVRARDDNCTYFAIIAHSGATVEIGWHRSGNPAAYPGDAVVETMLTNYWLPSILGYAIRLSGHLVLHGNAIMIDKRAALWLGNKGAGKSTLSLAFTVAGYSLLADDQAVIDVDPNSNPPATEYPVWRGFQRMRIYEDSLDAFKVLHPGLSLAYPVGRGPGVKGFLEASALAQESDAPTRAPLSAIFLLEPRDPTLTIPQFVQLGQSEALRRLMQHRLSAISLQVSPSTSAREFAALGAICRRVPVYRLTMPDDLAHLPQTIAGIDTRSRP